MATSEAARKSAKSPKHTTSATVRQRNHTKPAPSAESRDDYRTQPSWTIPKTGLADDTQDSWVSKAAVDTLDAATDHRRKISAHYEEEVDTLRRVFGVATDKPSHQLFAIARLIEEYENPDLGLELHELEMITDYVVPENGEWNVSSRFGGDSLNLRGGVGEDFLPALHWWWQIVGELFVYYKDIPAVEPYRNELVRLLDNIMKAFAPAERGTLSCSGDDSYMILLQHYGRYRRYIIDLAQALWPRVNWRDTLECKL